MVLSLFSKSAALALLQGKAGNWPIIENYTLKGDGWCTNEVGMYYSYESIPDIPTIEDCGRECSDTFGGTEGFVGINFVPGDSPNAEWFGGTVCNCMKDMGGNGLIAGANGWGDEVCYSYNDAKVAPAPSPREWPTIENFQLKGDGWCTNEVGMYYSYETLPDITTIEDCGRECSETFGGTEGFVGIGFLPGDSPTAQWFGGAVCNCMKDVDGNGPITGANGCCDEVCYSYDNANAQAVM